MSSERSKRSESQSLNLTVTVKSEQHTQQQRGSVKSEAKQNENLRTDKLVTSFRKFNLLPNNEEWYLAVIRTLGTDEFRIFLANKDTCYASNKCNYDIIRNKSYSTTNSKQFRGHFISAISKPNDRDYEIEVEDQWKGSTQNKGKYPRKKKLNIVRKAGNLRIIIATITVALNKKDNEGQNIEYLFNKITKTLFAKQQKNEGLLKDNIKFQSKYDESLAFMDEAISAKNNQEQELLSKFVLILNEKKKKIRALQQEIFRLKQNGNANINNSSIIQSSSVSNSLSPIINKKRNNSNNNNNKNKKPSVIIDLDEEVKDIHNDGKQNKKDDDGDIIIVEDIDDKNKNKRKRKRKDIEKKDIKKKKVIQRLDTDDIIAQINEQQNNENNKNTDNLEFDLSISDVNMEMNQSQVNDVNSLSFPINIQTSNRKKRKRNVLNEEDGNDNIGVETPNKKRKVTQNKQSKGSNKKRKISISSDTSTTSDDFNTNSII